MFIIFWGDFVLEKILFFRMILYVFAEKLVLMLHPTNYILHFEKKNELHFHNFDNQAFNVLDATSTLMPQKSRHSLE